jgi:DNA-binding beta-propeller fold protein YncE
MVTAEIPLLDPEGQDTAGGIDVGAGSAWGGVSRGEAGSVLRIDLDTNRIEAEIPVTSAPWRDRIVATDAAVWVASSGVLERIDPQTNKVVATMPFAPHDHGDHRRRLRRRLAHHG